MIQADVASTRVVRLHADGLRNLRGVEIVLAPGFNVFVGANGAGKTSLLEAVHLLGHGRSFRGGAVEGLVRRGGDGFSIYAEVTGMPEGRRRRLGMAYAGPGWTLRQDGETVGTLADFVRRLAVVTLEPNSHTLVDGSSEHRRRFLDWLLFHVEPDFLALWRRYMRALRQRNAALRTGMAPDAELAVWEGELAASGTLLQSRREALLAELEPLLLAIAGTLVPGLELAGVRGRSGWSAGHGLAEALAEGRASDRERGFTQRGPHRADWRLVFGSGIEHGQLSRGQAKLAAYCCLLGQAALLRQRAGQLPVLAVDDLAAELDGDHQAALVDWLAESGAQVLVTGTSVPQALPHGLPVRLFHVEQGGVRQLV